MTKNASYLKEYKELEVPYGPVSETALDYVDILEDLLDMLDEQEDRNNSEGEAWYHINFAVECLLGYYEWHDGII